MSPLLGGVERMRGKEKRIYKSEEQSDNDVKKKSQIVAERSCFIISTFVQYIPLFFLHPFVKHGRHQE